MKSIRFLLFLSFTNYLVCNSGYLHTLKNFAKDCKSLSQNLNKSISVHKAKIKKTIAISLILYSLGLSGYKLNKANQALHKTKHKLDINKHTDKYTKNDQLAINNFEMAKQYSFDSLNLFIIAMFLTIGTYLS